MKDSVGECWEGVGGDAAGGRRGEGVRIYEEKFPPHPPTVKKKKREKKRGTKRKDERHSAFIKKRQACSGF